MNSAGSMLQGYSPDHAVKPAAFVLRPYTSYTYEQRKAAVDMLRAGHPADMVAKRVGDHCSRSTLYRWRTEIMEEERVEEARRLRREERARELEAERQGRVQRRDQRHARREQRRLQRGIHQIGRFLGNQNQAFPNLYHCIGIAILCIAAAFTLFKLFGSRRMHVN